MLDTFQIQIYVKLKTNPSYVWRNVIESQDVVRQGCRRHIGYVKSTRGWQVPVCFVVPLELKDITVNGLFAENQREWDNDILQEL